MSSKDEQNELLKRHLDAAKFRQNRDNVPGCCMSVLTESLIRLADSGESGRISKDRSTIEELTVFSPATRCVYLSFKEFGMYEQALTIEEQKDNSIQELEQGIEIAIQLLDNIITDSDFTHAQKNGAIKLVMASLQSTRSKAFATRNGGIPF